MITKTGWVTTSRFAKRIGFIHIAEGTTFGTTQIVVPKDLLEQAKAIGIGTAIKVIGELKDSPGSEQEHEILAHSIEIIGRCDASEFPLQKKDATMEHLRSVPHLRVKTRTFQSVFRVRSQISHAIHQFFWERDFQWVHTPIITGSDCEGAGEMFSLSDKDFFGGEAGLTVSGQLEVEPFAQAFYKVYTFGPTFRAEDSHTSRHASEFWMVEPEIAFAELDDVMDLAEDFVKFIVQWCKTHCMKDLKFLREQAGFKTEVPLYQLIQSSFARITHDEAQDILVASGKDFEFPVGRGCELQSEHEKYLCKHFDGPVFVTHYPRLQKAFYMKVSEDRQTVKAMDLLVPGVGEIIGGSQREDDLETLIQEMEERGVPREELEWYLDLRRFGSVPHGGFGLGLERIIMWLTGMSNIRDVIPYPRVPGRMY